jgi:hypothetical protein
MILLVVAGGVNTLSCVVHELEKGKPVVVLADSGGAATDMYEYHTHGALPANTLDADEPGFDLRQQAVDEAIKVLPRIAELGRRSVGLQHRPLLSFTVQTKDASVPFSPELGGDALSTVLLEGALSSCTSAVQLLIYPISWGNAGVLRHMFEQCTELLTPDDLRVAFQDALLAAMRTRSAGALECVTVLLEAGVQTGGICFNQLCDSSFDRYARLNFESIYDRLLHKLGLNSLTRESFDADVDVVLKGIPHNTIRSLRDLRAQSRFDETETLAWASARRSSIFLGMVSGKRAVVSALRHRTAGAGVPMALGKDRAGAENALGFYALVDHASETYRAHLRARSRIGGSCLEPSYTDLGAHSQLSPRRWSMADCRAHTATPLISVGAHVDSCARGSPVVDGARQL